MAEIKAIEGRSVHQIQSGQVISDGLCSAVKELIENSIDAHATSIEVRFKNHGLELIEVVDNGDGILPDNFDKLALKHYTSKLRAYEDLEKVTTYGFRGEALSSLCALSTLTITTATANVAPKGSRIEFHTSGGLKSTSVTSHPRGTTVSVDTLFKNLPVRKQELERNIKREFARVVSFLQAYAIVCVGVKFTVYNQPPSGKKTLLFSTKANKTTKENIANVFGAKALSNLIPLDLEFEMAVAPSVLNRGRDDSRGVKIVGHISRPVFGEGRQAPDRQLFFVNSRPCNLPQVARAVNEVYKSFNLTQSPFVFADLQLDTTAYDVNVSPDKRTILLHDQGSLLESLKVALTNLFDIQDQTVPAATQSKLLVFKPSDTEQPKIPAKRHLQEVEDDDDDNEGGEANEGDEPAASEASDAPSLKSRSRVTGPVLRGTRSSKARPQQHDEDDSMDTTEADSEKRARNGLTYEQKGKIAKAFASRQSSHAPEDNEDGALTEDEESSEPVEIGTVLVDDEDYERHPLSQASPKPWRRASPHPTTVKIGNHTVVSTPKRSPSKVFPIISPSPKKSPRTKGPRNTFARKLQGFSAGGARSSLTIPEDDEDDSDREFAEPEPGSAADDIPHEAMEIDLPAELPGIRRKNVMPVEDLAAEDNDSEGESIEGGLDAIIDSEPWSGATSNVFRSSPPRQNIPPPPLKVIDSLIQNKNGLNDENGTEQQQKERERRRVDELIARAERSTGKDATVQVRPAAIARSDTRDSTHCLIQNLKPFTIENIRGLSTGLQLPTIDGRLIGNEKGKQKGKSKAKLVRLDTQEEKSIVEERLSLTIAKADFAKMKIAGQFNLGFILATRRSEKEESVNDLFIIDQHASDEKYNFERLQAETVVQNQPLVRPKILELSAMDELVVMDNMELLKKNGFMVEVDDEGDVGKRCRLVSLPMSKDKVFDMKDFEELLHLIREHPSDTSVRPSKVRAMFAMRACRSSIMIGRTLGLKDMQRVVKHMGELDKPWNCPHGRPTMRHLCDVGQLESWAEDREQAFVADGGDEEPAQSSGMEDDEEYQDDMEE